jgi:hypothetical protein
MLGGCGQHLTLAVQAREGQWVAGEREVAEQRQSKSREGGERGDHGEPHATDHVRRRAKAGDESGLSEEVAQVEIASLLHRPQPGMR